MTRHDLKTWPGPFSSVWRGDKTYEIRKADRLFMPGDTVLLREYEPDSGTYTGRAVLADISYVTEPGQWGLPSDICVFAMRVFSKRDA
jgi:hypothetical protein